MSDPYSPKQREALKFRDEFTRQNRNVSELTAKQIAEIFDISERSARRYRQRGVLPFPERRIGKDGKNYCARSRPGRIRSNVDEDLKRAKQALRRFFRKPRFHEDDLEELETITQEALRELNALRSALDGD